MTFVMNAMADTKHQDDEKSSIEDDLELLDKLNVAYDFSAWDTFRQSLSAEKRAIVRHSLRSSLIVPFRSNSVSSTLSEVVSYEEEEEEESGCDQHSGEEEVPSESEPSHVSGDGSSAEDVTKTITASSTELTEDERADNDKWRMRFMTAFGSVFDKNYVPQRWERNEMGEIIDFLDLKDPGDHQDHYLYKSGQETTKQAIKSIFFPKPEEQQSVLLKRGPVLVGGEDEMELMLFTNGFVLSHVETNTLVNLLLGVNGTPEEEVAAEHLCERFGVVDQDQSGSLDRIELNDMFLNLGVALSEDRLESLMNEFDTNRDGSIDLDEFKSIRNSIISTQSQESSSSTWGLIPAETYEQTQEKEKFTWSSVRGPFRKALHRASVTRKMNVAFRVSDIDRIEDIGKCYGQKFDSECAKITFAIYLKGVNTPLIMTCSKAGHVDAWMEAFRNCITGLKSQAPQQRSFRNSSEFTFDRQHSGLIYGLPKEKDQSFKRGSLAQWRGSSVDWGLEDSDSESLLSGSDSQLSHCS